MKLKRPRCSGSHRDGYFEEAKALVVEMQTASISLLQRRFRIGYNRAARLVDELEAHELLATTEGSKPRKVFIEQEETSETLPDDNDM